MRPQCRENDFSPYKSGTLRRGKLLMTRDFSSDGVIHTAPTALRHSDGNGIFQHG
jgi:hypothetical protein